MHPTADTLLVIYLQSLEAAGELKRYTASVLEWGSTYGSSIDCPATRYLESFGRCRIIEIVQ
jgi:hypothetical protein